MRISTILSAVLLPLAVFAAKRQMTTDVYAEYAAKSYPVKLEDQSLQRLSVAPREYGVAVLLTALEARFGCAACTEFQPEWEMLSKSWQKGDKKGDSRMIFGTLDFVDGKATFQMV